MHNKEKNKLQVCCHNHILWWSVCVSTYAGGEVVKKSRENFEIYHIYCKILFGRKRALMVAMPMAACSWAATQASSAPVKSGIHLAKWDSQLVN